jgi:hypothetical protein
MPSSPGNPRPRYTGTTWRNRPGSTHAEDRGRSRIALPRQREPSVLTSGSQLPDQPYRHKAGTWNDPRYACTPAHRRAGRYGGPGMASFPDRARSCDSTSARTIERHGHTTGPIEIRSWECSSFHEFCCRSRALLERTEKAIALGDPFQRPSADRADPDLRAPHGPASLTFFGLERPGHRGEPFVHRPV